MLHRLKAALDVSLSFLFDDGLRSAPLLGRSPLLGSDRRRCRARPLKNDINLAAVQPTKGIPAHAHRQLARPSCHASCTLEVS